MNGSSDRDMPHGERRPPQRRRAALVDALLCAAASVPVLAVLLGEGDLFLLATAMLPVAVMAICSLDPPDIAALAARLGDARVRRELERHRRH